MKWCLWAILFFSVNGVLNLENLTYFGDYLIFKPATNFINFNLDDEIDVLLLEKCVDEPGEEGSPIDYAYRVQLLLDEIDSQTYTLNCTIFKKRKIMVSGQYAFSNKEEKDNMGLQWGSTKNVLKVVTEINGTHSSIFSWRDKSKNHTEVRYLGLGVQKNSTEVNRTKERHLNWKLRGIEPQDLEIRNARRICDIKFFATHPEANPAPESIYEMFVTREEDENFAISLHKHSKEVLLAKTTEMDIQKILVSWDQNNSLISLGLENDIAPIFIWQDTEATSDDFSRIKFSNVFIYKEKEQRITELRREIFLTIPQLYPKYFTTLSASSTIPKMANDSEMNLTTVKTLSQDFDYLLPSSED